MATYFSSKISKNCLSNYKLVKREYIICRKLNAFQPQILIKSPIFVKCEKLVKSPGLVCQVQYENYSQKPPNRRNVVPSILSYFSSNQREARERRTDGITSLAKTPTHSIYSLLNSPGGQKKSHLVKNIFHAVQILNLSLIVGFSSLSTKYFMGILDLSSRIQWSEDPIQDYIGIGIIATLTPFIWAHMLLMMSRIPIRVYYDEYNGIYTAAFCRLFLPFKTVTFSFPTQSAEEGPPFYLENMGISLGPSLKIRPIQKDLYIHHLECLSAETNKIEDGNIKSTDYFPPAVASATAAINADESISQKRESHQSYKISKTGKPKKVGYMPPAYTAAVSAIAAEKAAEGNRFASWAAAEKTCYMPIVYFTTPSFYYKMLKTTSESD